MPKKTETKSSTSNQYNPASMGTYNAFQPQIQQALSPWLTGNPLASQAFQLLLGDATGNARNLAQRARGNIFLNAAQFGGVTPGQLAKQSRFGSSLQSNAFMDAARQAYAMQQWATQSAMGYQPLQTGQQSTQTQKTSGLGTWLPQVVGAGLSAFMPTGGLMGMLGGAGRQATGGMLGPTGFAGVPNPQIPLSVPGVGNNPFMLPGVTNNPFRR